MTADHYFPLAQKVASEFSALRHQGLSFDEIETQLWLMYDVSGPPGTFRAQAMTYQIGGLIPSPATEHELELLFLVNFMTMLIMRENHAQPDVRKYFPIDMSGPHPKLSEFGKALFAMMRLAYSQQAPSSIAPKPKITSHLERLNHIIANPPSIQCQLLVNAAIKAGLLESPKPVECPEGEGGQPGTATGEPGDGGFRGIPELSDGHKSTNITAGEAFTRAALAEYDMEGVKLFRQFAEQNYALGQFNLGLCYANGRGVEKDYAKAVQWFRRAAEQNYAPAQATLGICYDNGYGVDQNAAEAVQWFRKAAEQNYAPAQASLGVSYNQGQGVAKNHTEAVQWFRKAAEQHLVEAQYNLGVSYDQGQGVEKNDTEAVQWYRKAADQDFAEAQYRLGVCYYFGQGVRKDYAEAVNWYRKAAEQNFVPAHIALGFCYQMGENVVKDYAEAYARYNLVAEIDQVAAMLSKSLETRMSPQQIADARERTKELREQIAAKLNSDGK